MAWVIDRQPSRISRRSLLGMQPDMAEASAARDVRMVASFAPDCLSASGVTCRICAEHCETGAIRFALVPGGRAMPLLDALACTGCRACLAPCPASAISMVPGPAGGPTACDEPSQCA